MKSYSESDAVFVQVELEILAAANSAVRDFPDHDSKDRLIRCHEVARAILKLIKPLAHGFEPRVVDGKFDGVDHSWIAWQCPKAHFGGTTILDAYSVGSLPQVQIHRIGTGIRRADYRPDHLERDDIRHDVVDDLVAAAGGAPPEGGMPW